MGGRLFLLIIASLIGVVSSPSILTATDKVNLTGLDNTGIVETVPLPEPEPKPEPRAVLSAAYSEPVYTPPANNIQVAGRTLRIVDVADTLAEAGNHVNKYGSKFLYGHNTGAVFGGLAGLGYGSVFTVTYGGVTTNYSVANIVVFEKSAGGLLQINGYGDYMNAVSRAVYNGTYYDIALMTCAGTSLGGGDATHRLVIYAYAI